MTRNNMTMSFVILAILTSPAAAEGELCSILLKAVAESKTGFFSFRSGAAANNRYEQNQSGQNQSGWSTPFRLPGSEFCFIDNMSRPSLVCNYPTTSISSVVHVVQGCLSSDWTISSRKRFTKDTPGPPDDADDRIVFTNRKLNASIRVWLSGISEGVVVEVGTPDNSGAE